MTEREEKWTPGEPWHVEFERFPDDTKEYRICHPESDHDLTAIAYVMMCDRSDEEKHSAAHLIASAPALYEALMGVVDLFAEVRTNHVKYLEPDCNRFTSDEFINREIYLFDSPEFRKLAKTINEAIQMARGETGEEG